MLNEAPVPSDVGSAATPSHIRERPARRQKNHPLPQLGSGDLLEAAWGIIANANGGNWDKASAEWRYAASHWRTEYFARRASASEEPSSQLLNDASKAFYAAVDALRRLYSLSIRSIANDALIERADEPTPLGQCLDLRHAFALGRCAALHELHIDADAILGDSGPLEEPCAECQGRAASVYPLPDIA